jgi:hypothetical protein
MTIKAKLKGLVPPNVYNSVLLGMPYLNRLPLVNYETNMDHQGIRDILELLDTAVNLEGEIIECGASRCGTSMIMINHLRARGSDQKVYACDSFEGFDREELQREKQMGLTTISDKAFTSTSYSYVLNKIHRLGYEGSIIPIKGYFEQTLPSLPADLKFSFIFIDCDLKDSMMYCAETLWPRLTPAGILAFDDYLSSDFKGAQLAAETFVAEKGAEVESYGLMNRLYFARKKAGK